MGLVPEEPEPGLADVIAQQRELLSRLRAVVEAKVAEIAVLRQELDAERELRRRLELRLAELERRLSMDSTDSGTPSSKERIGAEEARRAQQQSERERRKERKRAASMVIRRKASGGTRTRTNWRAHPDQARVCSSHPDARPCSRWSLRCWHHARRVRTP